MTNLSRLNLRTLVLLYIGINVIEKELFVGTCAVPPLVVPPMPNDPNNPATCPTPPAILLMLPIRFALIPGIDPPSVSANPLTLSAKPAMLPAALPTTLQLI